MLFKKAECKSLCKLDMFGRGILIVVVPNLEVCIIQCVSKCVAQTSLNQAAVKSQSQNTQEKAADEE